MLLYLDLNCFNRPFDDQTQTRIAREAQAVFSILTRIEDGADELAWSAALTFENLHHPLADRREEIARWEGRAVSTPAVVDAVGQRAQQLIDAGLHTLDAVHLAFAESAGCDRFLTCDDRLLRRAS